MNAQLEAARAHPAAVISFVIAGLALAACALVAIAYMLGWVGSKPALPSAPTSMASPGLQVAGSGPDLALLPGETLVAPAEAPAAAAPQSSAPAASVPSEGKPPARAQGAPAPGSRNTAAAQRKPVAPIYAPAPPAPSSSTSYAQVLAPRAAPSRPNYTRNELAASTSFDRSLCVNCGTIASIGRYGPDWEVRVRFEDGSTETLRYPDRPRLRIGDRVHLEEGQVVPD